MSTGYRFQNLGLPGVPSKRAVSCWQTAMWNKQRSQDVSRNKWADSRCSPNCITERHCILHCATSRKVTGSIRGGVIGIFHWHNPSGRTMDLGLTQPLTEMSTRNISLGGWGGGEGGRCLRLTILPPSCAERLQIWEPQAPGNLKASQRIALPFLLLYLTFFRILKVLKSFSPRIKAVFVYRRRSFLPKSSSLRSPDVR